MAESQVKISITAEDKASQTIKGVADSLKQYQASYESIGQFTARQKAEADSLAASERDLAQATDESATSNAKLATTFTVASLAAEGILRAFSFIKGQIGESVQASRDYNIAMTGLATATASYGFNAQSATQQAKSLASDGILPITSSAKGLQNLMAGGLGLDQASDLIQTFMDRAAFGRSRSIEFGTAIENLTQAFRTEQSQLSDASGMTENYSQILEVGANQMGKNVESLTAAERAQAKFLGIQQLSAAQAGNYAQYLETDAAAQDHYNYQIEQTQRLLGAAIQPAIALAQDGFGSLIQSLGVTDSNMKNVQATLITLVAVAQSAGNILIGVAQVMVGAIQSLFSGSFKPLEQAINASVDRAVNTAVGWQKSMDKIATQTADIQIDESRRAVGGIADATNKATRDMLRDIEDANRQFARSQQQRLQQFQQSITDMVISHRDKSLSIKADLASEDAAYAASAKKREKSYQRDISDLEERHAEKVADITEKITDERNSGLIVDGVLYREASDKKLAKLNEALQEEHDKYAKSLARRKEQYQEDVAEDKARHNEKRTSLDQNLSEELAVLQKHRSEVAAVGNAQKEDDITRLKNQFAQANAEAERNHQEQIAKIRQRGTEQGATAGNSYTGGALGALNNGKGALATTMGDIGGEMGRRFADSLKQGMDQQAKGFDFTNWMDGIFKKMGEAFKTVKTWYKDTSWSKVVDSAQSWQEGAAEGVAKFFGLDPRAAKRLLTGRATGGVVRPGETTLVGERGPELAQFPPGTRITPATQTAQALRTAGGFTIQNLNITNNTHADTTAMLADIGWALSQRIGA